LLLAIGLSTYSSPAQQVAEPLPEVISAAVPFYPPIALAARVSGVVHLHLTTDGKRVSAITRQTGPAMLIPAAEANVRTWEFAEHVPTAFDVSFRYSVLEASKCETGNNPVVLHLPTEVEVDAAPHNCDYLRFFRNQKFLAEQHSYAVELHVIYNGNPMENPSEVTIANKVQSVTLPIKDGLFLVPESMAKGANLVFQARIGQDIIEISAINPNQLESIWTIRLADKTYGDDYPVPKGLHVHYSCILSFDGDGIYMTVDPCRKAVNR
jgi:hypothetical protein